MPQVEFKQTPNPYSYHNYLPAVVPLNVYLTVSPTQVETNTQVTLRCSSSHTPANLLFMMILDQAGVVVYHKDFDKPTLTQAGYYYSGKVRNSSHLWTSGSSIPKEHYQCLRSPQIHANVKTS